jgi:hypothetical protein
VFEPLENKIKKIMLPELKDKKRPLKHFK